MNNKSIQKSILNANSIDRAFVDTLQAKLYEPEYINTAIRMFIAGTLPIDVINKSELIDLCAIRKQIADEIRERRSKWYEHIQQQRIISEYYGTQCHLIRKNVLVGNPMQQMRSIVHFAFIDKSGHLVALGMDDGKNAGIYCAHNEVQDIAWNNLHKYLMNIRKQDRAFYKKIKKTATAEPSSMWKMDDKTIYKHER